LQFLFIKIQPIELTGIVAKKRRHMAVKRPFLQQISLLLHIPHIHCFFQSPKARGHDGSALRAKHHHHPKQLLVQWTHHQQLPMENSSSRMIWQRMQICAADSDGRITWTDHYDVRIHAGRRELLVPIISKDSTTGFTHRIRSFRNGTNSIRKHYTCRSKSWVQPSNASVPKHLLLEQTTVHVDENADAAPELDLQRRQIAEAHGAIDAGASDEICSPQSTLFLGQ